jgi:Zn-dependent protease with chaperone function
MAHFNWQIHVADSPIVNASCYPGGKIIIYTGLIEFAMKAYAKGQISSPVDAVAHVIAHEISHGIARHVSERVSWYPIQLPFIFMATDSEVLWQPFKYMFSLPHSRQMESEADAMAVVILLESGFDARQGAALMGLFTGSLGADWLSTHPSGERRKVHIDARTNQEDLARIFTRRARKRLTNPYTVGEFQDVRELSVNDLAVLAERLWVKEFVK